MILSDKAHFLGLSEIASIEFREINPKGNIIAKSPIFYAVK
jgi:hypothetical protein